MKKILLFLTFVAVSATFLISCSKESKEPTYSARIATYSEDWGTGMDQWVYTFNEAGICTGVIRNWVENGNPVLDKSWTFTWGASSLSISGSNTYEITFGSNGLASSMTESGDGWSETYTYTYNSEGYLISVSRDGELRSEITIENGNIKTWTRYSDGEWQTKNHTYSSVLNTAGMHSIYCEQSGAGRWLQELGYFGKACKNLCETNQWAHSDMGSTFSYDFDTNNNVTKVVKTYDGYDEISIYTWNMIEDK